jgi:hypothetical protein
MTPPLLGDWEDIQVRAKSIHQVAERVLDAMRHGTPLELELQLRAAERVASDCRVIQYSARIVGDGSQEEA